MCEYTRVCVCVCVFAYVLLLVDTLDLAFFCPDIVIVTLIHYFAYFARTEFN